MSKIKIMKKRAANLILNLNLFLNLNSAGRNV
jgi:hypothetical protein